MERCPPGTFSSQYQLSSEDQCSNCTGGFYCEKMGATSETDLCDPGWYCTTGASTPRPNSTLDGGGICDPGHECPKGSSFQKKCRAGYFAETSGKEACDPCPAGYFCPEGTVSPKECPRGHYCENGTVREDQFPCPVGTFNEYTKSQSSENCLQCLPGLNLFFGNKI